MNSVIKSILLYAVMVVLFSGCSSSKEAVVKTKPYAKHVILIGSDGFGAYAFNKAKIPNIRKMMNKGSYSLKARAVLPSSSAVNWASMIMGSGPELHGYTEWGSKVPELPSAVLGKSGMYPTIFSVIDKYYPEASKGVLYTWAGIGYLFEKDLVDMDFNGKTEVETVDKTIEYLVKEKPLFTFVHLDEPDHVGHDIGHDTPEYYEAVEGVDVLVGRVLTALEKNNMMEDSIIIFSSDHGGVNKGHGGKTLLEVEIPWIIYGKSIKAKGELNETIVTYDTAATIVYLLGLEIPESWRGKPVTSILEE